MNILINAYAVSPVNGSEAGVGWNWISNLAKYSNLYIITEGEWKYEIERAVENHPFKENIHFYYLPVSEKVRRMCWNQGDYRFYLYYKKWQKKVLKLANKILSTTDIDIVHQLNMVSFREPGYLWKLNLPIVWGPIGGMGYTPKRFIENASLKWKVLYYLKDWVTLLQLRFSPRVRHMFNRANSVIAAVPIAKQRIKQYKKINSVLIPETGCYDLSTEIKDKRQRDGFQILWVGRFIYTKRLDLALQTISKIKTISGIQFHIVGTGTEAQIQYYHALAHDLGIDDICIWHGSVDNKNVHEMMREADVFFFTSIREATSTVVPEAINNCLPIICFDACGFGPLVTERIGMKVKMTTPEQSINDFAKKLKYLSENKGELFQMSNNCKEALTDLLWEEKAKKVVEIYKSCIGK